MLLAQGKRQALSPAVIHFNEMVSRAGLEPLIKSAVESTASDYGSYDLITFLTGCSRQGSPSVTTYYY